MPGKKGAAFLQSRADRPKPWPLLPHEIGQPTRKNTHILMAARPLQWPGHTADARQCGVWWVWNDTALDCTCKLFLLWRHTCIWPARMVTTYNPPVSLGIPSDIHMAAQLGQEAKRRIVTCPGHPKMMPHTLSTYIAVCRHPLSMPR